MRAQGHGTACPQGGAIEAENETCHSHPQGERD